MGPDSEYRGTLDLGVDLDAWQGQGWALEVGADVNTLVRENRPTESVVRISPRRAVYGAVARLRLGQRWSLVALHRSHHDIDSDDSVGNRETISYEVYGAQWRRGAFRVLGGVWYDRGTTLDGRPQTLPFDHFLGGVRGDGLMDLGGPLYISGALELVAHRDGDHSPIPHLNTGGVLELGLRRTGPAAELRVGLALRRIEDPLFLGQPARHLILLSLRAGSGVLTL